ncbi:hypothetical protein [Clostridium thermobutyricum]|uniref:hypothetical protein n=1 Tax=Clostridium thermobutyricum TaxID=29372 RepID=UPI00294247B2|nr:hypothetical protein [Clostridium thermobutyricum]
MYEVPEINKCGSCDYFEAKGFCSGKCIKKSKDEDCEIFQWSNCCNKYKINDYYKKLYKQKELILYEFDNLFKDRDFEIPPPTYYQYESTFTKKLSELKNEDMLIVEDFSENYFLSKEELLKDLEYYKDKEIYITNKYESNIDSYEMLKSAFEREYNNMYKGWYDSVIKDITKEDIEEIQVILDRILSRSKEKNYNYKKTNIRVEIDI